MHKKISTNQYRSNIISYFLSQFKNYNRNCQITQPLIPYTYINSISSRNFSITGKRSTRIQGHQVDVNLFAKQSDFKRKLSQKLKIKNGYGIDVYIRKYRRGRTGTKFAGQKVFSFQQFLDTLIPYNPSVIRQSQFILAKNFNLNLEQYFPRQENSSHQNYQNNFKRIIKIYKEMATLDIHHTLALQSMQNDSLLYFKTVKEIIMQDLSQRSKIYEKNNLKAQNKLEGNALTLVSIRKWLELYNSSSQNRVCDQKDMLNISRWCKGFSEVQIKRLFKQNNQASSSYRSKSKNSNASKSNRTDKSNKSHKSKFREDSLKKPLHKYSSLNGIAWKSQPKNHSNKKISNLQKHYSKKLGKKYANQYETKKHQFDQYCLNKGQYQHSDAEIFNNKLIKTQSLQFINSIKNGTSNQQLNFSQCNSPKQITSANDKQPENFQQLFNEWILFCKMLIQNEKSMEFIKSTIKKTDEIDDIINSLYQKSQAGYLTISQISQFIRKFMLLSNQEQQRWNQTFKHLKLFKSQLKFIILKQPTNQHTQLDQSDHLRYNYSKSNTMEFNLINRDIIHYNLQKDVNLQPYKKGISQALCHTLFQYFQARYQLCHLAKTINEKSHQIFRFIDKTKSTYLNSKTLANFLSQKGGNIFIKRDQLNGSQTSSFRRNIELTKHMFQKQDIEVILDYFGDGKIVTQASFVRAITLQALGQFHNR